jgi:phage tail P2-like protein
MAVLDRMDALPFSILRTLYDPDTCPASALPLLALQFGVLDASWTLASTEAAKRGLVKTALSLQAKRGTPWALKQALAAVGWPGLEIQEGTSTWAHFKLVQPLNGRSVTEAELTRLRPTIEAWKPARCILEAMEFGLSFESEVPGTGPHYDGVYVHDGAIKYEGLVLSSLDHVKVGQGTATVQLALDSVTDAPGQKVIKFTIPAGSCNGMVLDAFTLHSAADTLIASGSAPPVAKASDITIKATWTLNLI